MFGKSFIWTAFGVECIGVAKAALQSKFLVVNSPTHVVIEILP